MTPTQPGGRPVDMDTLADYLEGSLATDETATVEDLIANDPAWSSTLAALRTAGRQVASALSAAAADTGGMPPDIASRIDEALGSMTAPSNVVSLAVARQSRADRVLRSAWIKAAAALIVVVVGLGFVVRAANNPTADESSVSSGTTAPKAAPQLATQAGVTVTASGTNYTAAMLDSATGGVVAPQPFPTRANTSRAPSIAKSGGLADLHPTAVPASLRRLLQPTALNTCLAAVEALTGGTATIIDFATYQGQPALIMRLTGGIPAIAVGATCGEHGVGADLLSRA